MIEELVILVGPMGCQKGSVSNRLFVLNVCWESDI